MGELAHSGAEEVEGLLSHQLSPGNEAGRRSAGVVQDLEVETG